MEEEQNKEKGDSNKKDSSKESNIEEKEKDKDEVSIKKDASKESTTKSSHTRSHWIVYVSSIFISFFVLIEFLGSLFFFSRLSPSSFVYHLTPAYLFFGRTIPAFLLSAILIFLFYVVLSRKVYITGVNKILSSNDGKKKNRGLIFKRANAGLLIPFYIIPLASLGYHIIVTPIDISNAFTYIIFLLFGISFVEYNQIVDFSEWIETFKR